MKGSALISAKQINVKQAVKSKRGKRVLAVIGVVFLLLCFVYREAVDSILYTAAEQGNAQQVKTALKFGADPNTTDGEFGITALMAASEQGDIATVQALLTGGADANAVSHYSIDSTTALREAESNNHTAIISLLKHAGAKR